MASVALEHVYKVYDDGTVAVSDLDLEVRDGEFMVLVGPSGCGKTTALRMVAGLEEISSGVVSIGDRSVNDVPAKDRDIAMVFQNYALYPHLTVAENMGFGLKLRKVGKAETRQRVERAGHILGLQELLGRKPRQLSGGQRQRVAMGRAIVREPQAFLMDEPLSNLDAKLRVQMRAEIARIQRDLEVTTLYVTHDQTEAMTMGDRVAVMKRGVLQQVDAPQQLYDNPVNLFVGGFIGSPAMNLLEARLEPEGDRLFASFGSHRLLLDAGALAARPSLRDRLDQPLVMGVRPEDLEDAELVPGCDAQRCLDVDVDLVEQMGSEAYVHFAVDAQPVLTDDTRDLARDAGDVGAVAGTGLAAGPGAAQEAQTTGLVARVGPRTQARKGSATRLVVDVGRLHFFDLATGEAISDGRG
ncbi:MAG: sn-glycerol-3-phosphate ABC transporter ATP-binding protein UgpC [Acidimicrobiia bacterium]|nr:sn-glycerol-3-phosphate ABC transporter ATP-binding protein UgpC [Acidimicrobiia bacterium]